MEKEYLSKESLYKTMIYTACNFKVGSVLKANKVNIFITD